MSIPLDTTVNYDGYSLIFTGDGKMQATNNNSVSAGGAWKIYSSSVHIEMEGGDFNYLDAYWTFLSQNASKVEFQTGLVGQYTMTLSKN